jgi:hypothetical protein
VAAVLVPDAALIERLRALRTAQTPTRHHKHNAS